MRNAVAMCRSVRIKQADHFIITSDASLVSMLLTTEASTEMLWTAQLHNSTLGGIQAMRRKRKIALTGIVCMVLFAGFFSTSSLLKWPTTARAMPHTEFHIQKTYTFNTLKNPTGLLWLSLAPSGSKLYIADSGKHVIRVFNPGTGTLSTVAGTLDTAGYVNGQSWTAKFDYPTGLAGELRAWCGQTGCNQYNSWGICISPQITCYNTHVLHINDSQNFVVRKLCTGDSSINSGDCTNVMNQVSTIAGNNAKGYTDGAAASASFAGMGGHTDDGGSCYMADAENHCIRKETSSGNVETFAGTAYPGFVDGYRTSARFNTPTKMVADGSGNMLIADVGNNAVRKIDSSGYVTTVAGLGSTQPGFADGASNVAKFARPTSLVQYGSYTYVADSLNHRIRMIDSSGNVSTYAGNGQKGLVDGAKESAQFNTPTELVINGGLMYISDSANNVIRRIDMSTGQVSTYIN